jgi:hypothetical protein
MRARMIAAAMAVGLSGCLTPVAPDENAMESISYETGPCFGACPIYRVTVNRDGTGLFEGRRFTAVEGERRLRLSSDHFGDFARQLEPLRPTRGHRRYSGEACETMATDLPSVEIIWRFADGLEQRLYFYHGCDMERNRPIAERLDAAPGLLPIGDLIGSRR